MISGGLNLIFLLVAATGHKAAAAAAPHAVERAPDILEVDRMAQWLNSSVVALICLNAFALMLFLSSFLSPQIDQLKKKLGELLIRWKDARALKKAIKENAAEPEPAAEPTATDIAASAPIAPQAFQETTEVGQAPIAPAPTAAPLVAETTTEVTAQAEVPPPSPPPLEPASESTETTASASPEDVNEAAIHSAIDAAAASIDAPDSTPEAVATSPGLDLEATLAAAENMAKVESEPPPAPAPQAFEEVTQTIELERPAAVASAPVEPAPLDPNLAEVTEILSMIPQKNSAATENDSSLPPPPISAETSTVSSNPVPPAGASHALAAKESLLSALNEVPSDLTEEIPIFDPSTLDEAFGAGSGKRRGKQSTKQKRTNG